MPFKYSYLWWKTLELNRFLATAKQSRQIQCNVLLSKLRRHASSAFGTDHGFSDIRSIADFRNRVPIGDYSYYAPYVDRVKLGETSAMFGPNTKVLMYAMTSGTTDRCKYIPITQEGFDEYRHGWHLWGIGA